VSVEPPHFTLSMKANEHGIHDLFVDEVNQLGVAVGPKAVALHVRWRLMTFEGEWFLDVLAGMRWLEDIMAHRYNPTLAEAMIKNEVLDTPGVTGINALSIGYDIGRRDLMIRGMDVATEYDDQAVWISNVGITT
jgi:hypothetical protein